MQNLPQIREPEIASLPLVGDDLRVISCPNLFNMERKLTHLAPGSTVLEILQKVQPDKYLQKQAFISIDGEPVEPIYWANTVPRPGCLVVIRIIPAGGIGRIILAVAMVVVSVVLTVVFPPAGVAAWLGTSLAVGGIVSAGIVALGTIAVGLVGNLIINALTPPVKPSSAAAYSAPGSIAGVNMPTLSQNQDSPTQFITGARNQLVQFGTIPRLLGFMRIVPYKMAEDYTEIVGADQYVRCLFGQYGPLDISDLKIGETAITEFLGVEKEIRQGYPDDPAITLYTKDIHEEVLSVVLEKEEITYSGWVDPVYHPEVSTPGTPIYFWQNAGLPNIEACYSLTMKSPTCGDIVGYTPGTITPGYWDEGHYTGSQSVESWTTRTTQPDVDRISIDIVCPNGLYAWNNYAGRTTKTISFNIWYRLTDTSGDWLQLPILTITGSTNAAVRKNYSWDVTKGQYDMKIGRITSADTGNDMSISYWTALRSIKNSPPITYPDPLAKIAVRIKASEQLHGTLDELNFYGMSIVWTWNSEDGEWQYLPSNNPAALFRAVLQDVASPNPIPDERIDIAKLEYWSEFCSENGWRYNKNIDQTANWWDLLKEIAAAGRAAPCQYDGKWSVVIDELQDAPVTIFNPRTMKDLEVEITYPDMPHGFRCPFKNELKDFQSDERIVLDDGYQIEGKDAWGNSHPEYTAATKFEQLELPGVTHPSLIFKLARYHIASGRLRFRKISFSTNIQQLVCTRGDKILISHDVMLVGIASGRVKTVNYDGDNIVSVTTDEECLMEAGKTYGLQLRIPGEEPLNRQIVTNVGSQTTLVFSTPIVPEVTNLADGDLVTFGEFGSETIPVIVKSIEQKSGMWAKITCVDEAPELHQADQGVIPEHISEITTPVAWNPPVAEGIRSDISVMFNTAAGWQYQILVTMAAWQSLTHPNAVGVEAIYWASNTDNPRVITSVAPISNGSISITPVEVGMFYDFKLRFVNRDGTRTIWSEVYRHKVVGLNALPDVENLISFYRDNRVMLKWGNVVGLAIGYPGVDYEIRKGTTWSTAEVLGRVTDPEFVTQGDGYYWVAAHFGITYSPNPTGTNISGSVLDVNVVATHGEYSDNWPGTRTNTLVSDSGYLELSGFGLFDDIPDLDSETNTDLFGGITSGIGYYEIEAANIVDVGDVQPCVISASYVSLSHDYSDNIDNYFDFDTILDFDGYVAGITTTKVQIATAGADGVFGAWQDFFPGQYYARKFKFRLALSTIDNQVTPMVTAFSWTVDMPDRTESGTVELDAGGEDITFSKPFQVVPAILITVYNATTGDEIFLTNKTVSGFHLQIKNGGVGAARTIHHLAKAY